MRKQLFSFYFSFVNNADDGRIYCKLRAIFR